MMRVYHNEAWIYKDPQNGENNNNNNNNNTKKHWV
jgi:hypothetical protein